MGVYVGSLASIKPSQIEPVPAARSFADLAQRETDEPSVTGLTCPTSQAERAIESTQVGPYNPISLAGRALSLSASLSPDYLQAYLAGLEDLSALRQLPEPSRRRR